MSASGATLIKADQEATNGVIQVINKVLYNIPDETASNYIQENSRLRRLTMLMQVGGYPESLDSNVLFFFFIYDHYNPYCKISVMMKTDMNMKIPTGTCTLSFAHYIK